MDGKWLVTIESAAQGATARQTGVEVLAEYPSTLLVRATDAQRAALDAAGLESAPVQDQTINLQGAAFEFASARAANERVPVVPADPNRKAYYLVQCVGPIKDVWLDAVKARGGVIHGSMPSFTLIVGMTPAAMTQLEQDPWVEGITPYRPAMKVAAELRGLPSRTLRVEDLAEVNIAPAGAEAAAAGAGADEPTQIEVSVFPGESTSAIAAAIRSSGGVVLAETATSVTARASATAITALAERPGVQAILPHRFAKLFNDRATTIMAVPPDHTFEGRVLTGAGQIVAVADSGLDTGDTATLHADLNGRVVALSSFPTPANFASFVNDPPAHDDGTDDRFSAHGTHVAGSVLGDGARAATAGSPFQPRGVAPEAQLVFQAVEQEVNWKSRAELLAEGINPGFNWPPESSGLYGIPQNLQDLFAPAYAAGARIHTNSWGSADPATFGQYDAQAQAVDEFMFTHRDLLVLFAAGNDGADIDGNGVIDLGAISPPGTAKNALTVGASENNRPAGSNPAPGIDRNWNQLGGAALRWPTLGAAGHVSDSPGGMAAFSSRGPTAEGRVKPEVVAPGTNVLSLRSAAFLGPNPPLWGDLPPGHPLRGIYCWSGGTSMSCPLVAGAAAIVRQYLVDVRGHFSPGSKPSSALVKAVLINGSAPMAGQFSGEIPAGRNSVCGFGRVDLTQTLEPGDELFFDDEPDHALATGEMRVFAVQAADPTRPIKVTLVWTDAPSVPGNGSLENQLYLQVRRANGTIENGDVAPFPTATNNTQHVTLNAPGTDTHRIRVRGISITTRSPAVTVTPGTPRQDFALVVTNVQGLTLE